MTEQITEAELAAIKKIARDLSIALTSLTPGGSEYFRRHGDESYADPQVCTRVIREIRASHIERMNQAIAAHRALRKQVREVAVASAPIIAQLEANEEEFRRIGSPAIDNPDWPCTATQGQVRALRAAILHALVS